MGLATQHEREGVCVCVFAWWSQWRASQSSSSKSSLRLKRITLQRRVRTAAHKESSSAEKACGAWMAPGNKDNHRFLIKPLTPAQIEPLEVLRGLPDKRGRGLQKRAPGHGLGPLITAQGEKTVRQELCSANTHSSFCLPAHPLNNTSICTAQTTSVVMSTLSPATRNTPRET